MALPAAAQEGGDPFGRAMEGVPPSGVRTGDPVIPPVPATAPAPAPAASGPAGFAGPAGPAETGPAGASAADDPEASAEINANYDATMGIYSKILDAQGYETGGLDRRILSNEEIVTRYKPELTRAEDELRRLQVDWMNSAFRLRQQKEMGALSEDAFQKRVALEEQKFLRRRSAVQGDVAFYREEIAAAERRLGEMRTQRVAVEERAKREGKAKPKPVPASQRIFDDLGGRLEKLGPLSPRLPMDGAIFDVGRVGSAKAPEPALPPVE
jgi:hypothetical protein